jgi:hypothetical protein
VSDSSLPHFPPPVFGKVPLEKGKVRVIAPDPETGERTVAIVDHEVLRPPAKTKPRPLEPRVSPCWAGWSAIHLIDHRLRIIDFWEEHAASLTKEECSDLANKRASAILRPAECPPSWCKGDILKVANNVEAEVREMEVTGRGHRTVLRVIDYRPWLMKQTVGGSSRPRTDKHGYASEPTDREKERARIDGNYTRSAAQAVPETDDVMDDKLAQRIHGEASMKTALAQSKGRVRISKMRLEQRLLDARTKHQTSTVKVLERKLKAAYGHVEHAA